MYAIEVGDSDYLVRKFLEGNQFKDIYIYIYLSSPSYLNTKHQNMRFKLRIILTLVTWWVGICVIYYTSY